MSTKTATVKSFATDSDTVNHEKNSRAAIFGQEDYPIIFREPEDIRLHRRKDTVILLQSLIIVVLAGLAFWIFLRKPDLIVAVTSADGQRVVSLNNREFGQTESVQLGKDNLSNADKTYLVSEFARLRFGVDLASREKDVEKILRMCLPRTAVTYAKDLRERGVLEKERSESWQGVWSPQSVKIDERDPYTLRVIGTQEINKNVNGEALREAVQYEITFKLTTDGSRADDNFRTGFKVAIVSEQEISRRTN